MQENNLSLFTLFSYIVPEKMIYNFKSLSCIRNENHESGAILVAPGSQNLPFNEEAFDVALRIQAPALVENDKHFFTNVRCLLRPGGILVVTMTNH